MERKLIDLLPERYLASPEVGAAAGIIWVLGEVFRARALDWLAQLCIDTATWGIVHWEREYGVTPQATDTLDDRRSRVKAKLRAPQTVTAAMLENLTDSYINGQSEVTELPRQHKVKIRFNGEYGVPANLESLTAALLEVLPSHVVYEYLYRYLLVREVHGMTINELQSHTLHDFAF